MGRPKGGKNRNHTKEHKLIVVLDYLNNDLPIIKNTDVNVYYKVKTQKHGWLPEAKNLEDYAGWKNSPIVAFAVIVISTAPCVLSADSTMKLL